VYDRDTMERSPVESETVFKGVRVRREVADWLDGRAVNFSELVRRLLDEYIAREDGPRRENDQKEAPAVTA
jgi:hypothetical protein